MKINKVIVLIVIVVFIILFPNFSYGAVDVAAIGGKLLEPIMDVFVALCDGVIDLGQKIMFSTDADAIVNINRTGEIISKVLGVICAAAFIAISIGLAVFFAVGVGAATVTVVILGVNTAVLSIKNAVIMYFAVSTITSNMLPDTFYLPFISLAPENIISNKIELFDVNFFEGNNESTENEGSNIAQQLHETISKWYYILRNIVMVLFMIILLYLGIRILFTSISNDKAKYKEMLYDWLVSFVLLFVIHYIMIFSIQIVENFTALLRDFSSDGVEYEEIQDDKVYDYVKNNLIDKENKQNFFEEAYTLIKSKITHKSIDTSGGSNFLTIDDEGQKTVNFPVDNFTSQARIRMQLLDDEGNQRYSSIGWQIIYIMTTLYTVVFAVIYLKRVVYIAFLILIAPLVVLTYSIDKLNDGQAQGFNTWLKEFLFNLAIQPFHMLLYMIFVGSAMQLASNNPIYVIIVMGFICQAEKILRKMFGFEKASTPGVLGGVLGTGLAMAGIKKVFGGHPEQVHNSPNNKILENEMPNSQIREQNTDEMYTNELKDQDITSDRNTISAKDNIDGPKDETRLNLEPQVNRTINTENLRKKNKKKNKKIKFNVRKALKASTRHYVQSKGMNLAKKAQNMNLARSGARLAGGVIGGMAAATSATLVSAVAGESFEKTLANAGMIGAVGYRGGANIVNSNSSEDLKDAYIKGGYGEDYSEYEEQQLNISIKHNLDNRTLLEQKLGWDKKEIEKFYSDTLDEYLQQGVKNINDMIIGEKLKKQNVVQDTKQAIELMYMGEKIGQDTRKLTNKKREEWSDTLVNQSKIVSSMQDRVDKIEKEYGQRIEKVNVSNLPQNRKTKEISKINIEKQKNMELQNLTSNIGKIKNTTMEKLDLYSKIKYKG